MHMSPADGPAAEPCLSLSKDGEKDRDASGRGRKRHLERGEWRHARVLQSPPQPPDAQAPHYCTAPSLPPAKDTTPLPMSEPGPTDSV